MPNDLKALFAFVVVTSAAEDVLLTKGGAPMIARDLANLELMREAAEERCRKLGRRWGCETSLRVARFVRAEGVK